MHPKFCRSILASVLLCFAASSCTTAYDAHGRPRQVVDPAAALIGAAVVGLVAYGLANSNDRNDRNDCRDRNRYRSGAYSRGWNNDYWNY